MESVIALQGADFVVIAADVACSRSVVVMKDDMDKITELDPHKLFAAAGIPGDVVKFTERVQKDVKLNSLRLGIPMSTAAVANYARRTLSHAIRYACPIPFGRTHSRGAQLLTKSPLICVSLAADATLSKSMYCSAVMTPTTDRRCTLATT